MAYTHITSWDEIPRSQPLPPPREKFRILDTKGVFSGSFAGTPPPPAQACESRPKGRDSNNCPFFDAVPYTFNHIVVRHRVFLATGDLPRMAIGQIACTDDASARIIPLGDLRFRIRSDTDFWLDEQGAFEVAYHPWGSIHHITLPQKAMALTLHAALYQDLGMATTIEVTACNGPITITGIFCQSEAAPPRATTRTCTQGQQWANAIWLDNPTALSPVEMLAQAQKDAATRLRETYARIPDPTIEAAFHCAIFHLDGMDPAPNWREGIHAKLAHWAGNDMPPAGGEHALQAAQAAETAEALLQAGDTQDGMALLHTVARSATTYTNAPGAFPEYYDKNGYGLPNYLSGNVARAYMAAMIQGLFGWQITGSGPTWSPAIPDGWELASLQMADTLLVMAGTIERRMYRVVHPEPRPLTLRVRMGTRTTESLTPMEGEIRSQSRTADPAGDILTVDFAAGPCHELRITLSAPAGHITEA